MYVRVRDGKVKDHEGWLLWTYNGLILYGLFSFIYFYSAPEQPEPDRICELLSETDILLMREKMQKPPKSDCVLIKMIK